MKILLSLTLLSLTILPIVGCIGNSAVTSKLEVDIEKLLSQEVSIYDIISDIDLICLGDSIFPSNSVYNGTKWIDFNGEKYYVLDPKTLSVYVYDKLGAFILKADLKGRGPGEYSMAEMLRYNEDSDLIEILDPMGRIYRYTADSVKFHSLIDYTGNSPLSSFYYLGSDSTYTIYSYRGADKLWMLREETVNLQSFGYCPPEYLRRYLTSQRPIFEWNGEQYLYRTYDGLIYRINTNDLVLEKVYEWDFGKYNPQLKDIPKDKSNREYVEFILSYSTEKISPFIDMYGWNNSIIANIIFNGGKVFTLIYNLDNSESILFYETIEKMKLFQGNVWNDGMYILVESDRLSEFVNRDILDDLSKIEYDKIKQAEGIGIVWYKMSK